jgi:BRCT domain type II-containing protein
MHASKMSSAEDSLFPQPLPSPVKKPAQATPKPPSKAKAKAKTTKPRSRAGASAKSGTRPRGLPLDVRRRIEVIAQNLLATDFDDDDPIDFLR